jgi:hypothetical protein
MTELIGHVPVEKLTLSWLLGKTDWRFLSWVHLKETCIFLQAGSSFEHETCVIWPWSPFSNRDCS